jgi:hypothetical protein
MAIPAVKLILVDKPMIAAVPSYSARRSQHTERSLQTTADLRWSRVEEFLRRRELRPNTLNVIVDRDSLDVEISTEYRG